MTRLPSLLALAVLVVLAGPVGAETIESRNIFVEFLANPSAPELVAAERFGAKWFAKGEAAGRPVTISVARNDATTMISFESVAVCERAKGCPLLVFRDIAAKPVLETMSFQNLILQYRDKGTYLVIRVWDNTTECLVSGVLKARCKPVTRRKPSTN
ncbi:hypothetical protein CU669_14520 [Paramagnetospirillum kuznetsovii]|uniref:Uncharacterized protein n=1 Tax=Paramagnetospirillum kuznetsovii TaxID=2053833 RepID=A0A364NVZ5_9PROT|nr:hypothetical protein [Paramagnetospirillum kuznetsovii]RAU21223.1 hypothetical protein CU669_14520 [Paramagnetospirillum kuznetsovii]